MYTVVVSLVLLLLVITAILIAWKYRRSIIHGGDDTSIVFVLGKGGVGKSTYSANIADTVVELDEIVRVWLNESPDGYAFDVYRPGGNEYISKLKDRLVAETRSKIHGRVCAIEGAVEDPELLRRIADGYSYTIVYLRPATAEMFKKSMVKRVNAEYNEGNLRLGRVWNSLSEEELADYKKHGDTGELFNAFMDRLASEKYVSIDSTLPLLAGLDYCVKNVSW